MSHIFGNTQINHTVNCIFFI